MELVEKYRELVLKLFPPGKAWVAEDGSVQVRLAEGIGTEFARIEERARHLLEDETNPLTATELLPEWEKAYGLPDPCLGANPTLEERRRQVDAKDRDQGGRSLQRWIDLAAQLGFTVTATTFRPFRMGSGRMGDALNPGDWRYVLRFNAPATTVVPFTMGNSSMGDPLKKFGNAALECVMSEKAPAHGYLLFAYGP